MATKGIGFPAAAAHGTKKCKLNERAYFDVSSPPDILISLRGASAEHGPTPDAVLDRIALPDYPDGFSLLPEDWWIDCPFAMFSPCASDILKEIGIPEGPCYHRKPRRIVSSKV